MAYVSGDSVDLDVLIDAAAENNPASTEWKPFRSVPLDDDVHSPTIAFHDHSRDDIDQARRCRLASLVPDDTRSKWLQTSPTCSQQQLAQIMAFDNYIIVLRTRAGLRASIPDDYHSEYEEPTFSQWLSGLSEESCESEEEEEEEALDFDAEFIDDEGYLDRELYDDDDDYYFCPEDEDYSADEGPTVLSNDEQAVFTQGVVAFSTF